MKKRRFLIPATILLMSMAGYVKTVFPELAYPVTVFLFLFVGKKLSTVSTA